MRRGLLPRLAHRGNLGKVAKWERLRTGVVANVYNARYRLKVLIYMSKSVTALYGQSAPFSFNQRLQ
jgi:hypothetical protein